MTMSTDHLAIAFPGWVILDAAGGGWYAIRTVLVPRHRGLSNVRCGASLDELYRHLESETRRSDRPRTLVTAEQNHLQWHEPVE
jgi:hypothetical protein